MYNTGNHITFSCLLGQEVSKKKHVNIVKKVPNVILRRQFTYETTSSHKNTKSIIIKKIKKCIQIEKNHQNHDIY